MHCLIYFNFTVLRMYSYVVIFHVPVSSSCGALPSFSFDLSTFHITAPLGVLWHPIEKKGQDFAFSVKYVGFLRDLDCCRVSLPEKKHMKLLVKINAFLSLASCLVTHCDCASLHGSLQHVTFIYKEGHSNFEVSQ